MPAHLIAEEGPNRGLILNLEKGTEWVIGRDPESADFVIEDNTVSRRHARLTKTEGGIYLKNLSRVNPTLVNDEEKREPVLLKEGDRVQIGNTVFLYSEEEIPQVEPKKGGYDDIFGDVEPIQSAPKPVQEPVQEPVKLPPAPPKPETTAYDTIFEDSGTDEELLPFNLVPESPLMLKVIAGPNAGAEIGLERGRSYVMGKDPNSSDIVFQDLSVSRNHGRLSVAEDGTIEIEDLGSKNGIAVNGALISEKRKVTPQDLVSLGTTVFMIIDREAPQETIYSPVVPSFEAPKAEEPVVEEPVVPVVEERTDWKREPIPPKYLVLAGSAAAIFLVMFLSFFSLFKSGSVEVAHKEPVSEIKTALEKFSGVQYSYNPGSGKLFLVGHVLTGVEYQEMKFRLSQIPFITSVEDTVVIDEGVWKTMNDVLSGNEGWRGVSIHSPAPGRFVVSGYIANAAEATRLSDYLTVNFPYLDKLENDVVIEENLNVQIQSFIASQKDLGAVTFQLSNGSVVLTGRYNEKRADEFQEMVKDLNRIKGVSSVKNFAVAVSPNQASIDLTQQYQVSGTSRMDGRGYSAIMNGKIYTLGDLVDGMRLVSIEPNIILLEKDGLKYKIDYAQ
jgi:type III secretion system YscD/HrpQ family protein